VVHDEPSFLDPLATSLRSIGVDVAAFRDAAMAWDALASPGEIEILVTRVQFDLGMPNGVALAKWARVRCPSVRILFVALPEFQGDVEDLGVLLPRPVSVPQVAEAIGRMLSNDRLGRSRGPDPAPGAGGP